MNFMGELIKKARTDAGLTQAEYAAKIGISQPFLSRLESGQRRDVSRKTWEKLADAIPELYTTLVISQSYDLRAEYDQALMSYMEGDHDNAELRFRNITRQHFTPEQPVEYEIQVASTLRLGNLQRDRGKLTGPDEALALYESLLEKRSLPSKLLMEVEFMKAACHEMMINHHTAIEVYLRLFNEFGSTDKVRCASRLGAIMTKIREYGQAEIYLRYAIERSVALDSGVQYSYAHEKRGILLAKQGNFDDARNEILKARTEIKSTHALRKVQSAIAEAQVITLDTHPEEALKLLLKARKNAIRFEFQHQLTHIDRLIRSIK